MRQLLLAAACALVISCSAGKRADAKGAWSYDANPNWPGAIYSFNDDAGTKLYGRCHGRPVFSLTGGDYPARLKAFELDIDGKRHRLPAGEHKHGPFWWWMTQVPCVT